MTNFQKIGGVAALIEAATFVFGLALFFTILAPYGAGELDPAQTVAFLLDNRTIMYVWNQVIYVVFGIFLVVLSLALHARLQAGAPAVMQVATAFGLIWAGLVIVLSIPGELAFTVWLLWKGVRVEQWEQRALEPAMV